MILYCVLHRSPPRLVEVYNSPLLVLVRMSVAEREFKGGGLRSLSSFTLVACSMIGGVYLVANAAGHHCCRHVWAQRSTQLSLTKIERGMRTIEAAALLNLGALRLLLSGPVASLGVSDRSFADQLRVLEGEGAVRERFGASKRLPLRLADRRTGGVDPHVMFALSLTGK